MKMDVWRTIYFDGTLNRIEQLTSDVFLIITSDFISSNYIFYFVFFFLLYLFGHCAKLYHDTYLIVFYHLGLVRNCDK